MAVQNIDRSSVAWANFNKFVDFTKQEGVKNDTVARFEWTNASKTDFSLERSTSDTEKHLKDILPKTENETQVWWNGLRPDAQKEALKNIAAECSRVCMDVASAVSVEKFVEVFNTYRSW